MDISMSLNDPVIRSMMLFETRTSKKYLDTMSQILIALNQTLPNQLTRIEVDELVEQTGSLVYFSFRDIPNKVPLDFDFVQELFIHLRRPLTLMLKKSNHRLSTPHRRVLSKLINLHELERLTRPDPFNIETRFKSCLTEMVRLYELSQRIKGSRKLDILMEALRKPSQFQVEVQMFLYILKDRQHPMHEACLDWLSRSTFNGDGMALKSDLRRKLAQINSVSNDILEEIEQLSGLRIHKHDQDIQMDQSWYTLGQALPQGQAFINSFVNNNQAAREIKRLTFLTARIHFNAGYISSKINKIMDSTMTDGPRLSKLCVLFFDIRELIESSTGMMSLVHSAIESDRENGMLNEHEYREALEWVRINRIRLQEILIDLFQTIDQMAKNNPSLLVPQAIRQASEDLNALFEKERQDSLADFNIENLVNLRALTDEMNEIMALEDTPTHFLIKLTQFIDRLSSEKEKIDLRDVSFIKHLRLVLPNFEAYEEKMIEIMELEDQLDKLYEHSEKRLLKCYRNSEFIHLPQKVLNLCLKQSTRMMFREVRETRYTTIQADLFEAWLRQAKSKEPGEAVLQIYQITKEIHAIPEPAIMVQALQDWKKDLSFTVLEEKINFLRENSVHLKECVHKCRQEMRELLGKQTVRIPGLYFEVFGLSDYDYHNLDLAGSTILERIKFINTPGDIEFLSQNLCALEAHIIMAQKLTHKNGSAEKKILALFKKGLIPQDLFKQVIIEMRENYARLGNLLAKVNIGQEELQRMRQYLGIDGGKGHLNLKLDADDMEELRQTYNFVEQMTIPDTKKFCIAYNAYNMFMKEAVDALGQGQSPAAQELKKMLTRDVFKYYQRTQTLPDPVKIQTLLLMPRLLESLAQLLCYSLNFINPGDVVEKSVYRGVLRLLARKKAAKKTEARQIKRLWGKLQSRLLNFKPQTHQALYESNRHLFIKKARKALEGGNKDSVVDQKT